MSINYKICKSTNFAKEEKCNFIRINNKSIVDDSYFASELSKTSSFAGCDVYGMIKGLVRLFRQELAKGNAVRIDGFGTFTLDLSSHKKLDPNRASNINVFIKNVRFTPTKDFMIDLMDTEFKKIETDDMTTLMKQDRLKNIMKYIDEYGFVKINDVRKINNCCRSTADKDLYFLAEKGCLERFAPGCYRFCRNNNI